MLGMNSEQLKSIVRWVATIIGGIVAGLGVKVGLDEGTITAFFNSEAFIGVILALLSLAFGVRAKTEANLVINTANAVPSLEQVTIIDPKLRAAVKANKPHVEVTS